VGGDGTGCTQIVGEFGSVIVDRFPGGNEAGKGRQHSLSLAHINTQVFSEHRHDANSVLAGVAKDNSPCPFRCVQREGRKFTHDLRKFKQEHRPTAGAPGDTSWLPKHGRVQLAIGPENRPERIAGCYAGVLMECTARRTLNEARRAGSHFANRFLSGS
jgi:hypothetical protein